MPVMLTGIQAGKAELACVLEDKLAVAGIMVASARRTGLDGLRGRTLDDTRHSGNPTGGKFSPLNEIVPQ
jgi:hypothetical protein